MLTETILLIVDNDAERLETIEKVLREADYQTIKAHNNASALDFCRQKSPAVSIVFVNNSEDEKANLASEIKTISPAALVLVIAPDFEVNINDCDAFLIEPVDERNLLLTIKRLVKIHQTQSELRLKEQRLDALTKAVSNVVWTNKAANSALALAQAFNELNGKTNGDAHSLDWFEQLHPEDKQQFDFERAPNSFEPFHSQYRVRGEDGDYKKFKVYGVPVFNHDGSFREWVGTINDITVEQMAQDELSQQVALFQLSFEPIFAWDYEGGIVYWNNGCEQLYGYSIGETLGKISHELLKSKFPTSFDEYKKTLETTGRWSGIINHTLKDGRILIVESRQMLTKIGGKRLVLEANRDVTEHHLAEEKLRASEERYRAFIKQSSEGIWRFELEEPIPVDLSVEEQLKLAYERGYLAECNEAMARMYGIESADEMIGARISDLFADDAANEEYLRRFLESGYSLSDAESHEKDRNGRDVYFSNNLVGIVENGNLVRAWGTQRDITAVKESEKVLTRYRLISAQARDIVLMLRPNGDIIEANAAASKIYGYSIEELLTKNIADLRSRQTVNQLAGQLEKANLDGILFETVHRRKDGSEFDAEVNAVGSDIGGERFILSIIRDITERKRTEQNLRASEEILRESAERLKLAADTAALGTWDYDLVRGELIWSENQFKIFGYEPVEPEFEMFDRCVHPDDYALVLESIKKAETEQAPYKLEYRIFRADTGELRWLSVNGRFFYDENGAPIRFIGASLDVTESKINEERIKRGNERFHIAEEASNGFLYDWNALTNYVERSASFAKVLGYSPTEINTNAKQWKDLIHPDDLPQASRQFRDAIEKEENYSIEYRVKHKEGHYLHVIDKGLVIRDETGKTIRVVGTTVDISEIKRAQLRLQKSEERFRLLTENLDNIFWIYDWQKRQLEYLSPAFERVVGEKPDTLFSGARKWAEIIHPEDAWQADTAFLSISETGEYDIEYRIVLTNGEIRWLRDKALPVYDEAGNLVQIVGVAEDITERREIENALHKNREQLRLSTEAAQLAPWSWNIVTNEVFLAAHHAKLWGMLEPQLIVAFEDWAARVHPEDREKARLNVETAKANRSQYESEYRVVPLDGTQIRWIRSVGRFIYDAEGNATQMYGVDYDITERKQFETALGESEKRYRNIFNSAAVSIWEEDFSGVKTLIESLRAAGVKDFRRYFEQNPQSVVEAAALVRIIDVNAETLKMFRAERKEDLIESLEKIFVPETLDIFREELIAFAENRREVSAETRLRKLTGEPIDVLFSVVFPETSADGESVMVSIVDITERKKAENALRESEARFRNMADYAPVMIWITDENGNATYLSKSWYEFTGQSPESALGFGWLEIIHKDDRQRAEEEFIKSNSKRAVFSVEYRLRAKDGNYRWFIDSAAPRFDENGEFLGYIGSVFDIAERKQAEEAMLAAERHASEQYLELLSRIVPLAQTLGTARELETIYRAIKDFVLTSMPCLGFFVSFYDAATNLRTPAYCWGEGEEIDISALPPIPLTENGGPNSQAVFNRQTVVVNGYQETIKSRPHVLTGVDNGILPKSSIAVPMIVMNRIIGTVEVQASENNAFNREHVIALEMASNLAAVAIENVRLLETEANARREAELANRSKDEFLAVLSHELRTPLNSMFGWVRMLSTGQLDAEKTRRAVEVIERNINLQTKLIEDILDVSRIISGKIRLENRQIDFLPLVNSVVELTQPTAETKNVEIVTDFDSEACILNGDSERLQQVVNNLLTNAIKFTPAGGRITVKLNCNETRAELKVIDTGIGIEPEFLPYVFERFRQADSSSKRKHGGLGLGLAIVKHLVEMHGGEVAADSAGAGQGATFTIRLPMHSRLKQAEEKSTQTNEEKDADLQNIKLLVVDDDTDALEMLKTVLSAHGASVTTASSAIEALKIIEKDLPDVLVSDIGMPEMNGMEMIGKIRESKNKKLRQIPAIAVTAYASTEDRERILSSGFNLYQHKPVNFAELVKNIKKAVKV